MALFRRGIPRRALVGAFLGFLYGCLIMPTGGTQTFLAGVGWIILSISLLFSRPISYYVFVAWGILWVAWKGVAEYNLLRDGEAWWVGIFDVLVPLACVALLSSSGYLDSAREHDAA
jgi:hypothetical protein